jgi:hypothetical protein
MGEGLILMRVDGGSHVHHHGILAGLGAGAVAVLGCVLLAAALWRRISGPVTTAVTVMVYALAAVVIAAAAYTVWFLYLRARYHAANPDTLTRQRARAEVIPSLPPEAPAIPAPVPLAALPPAPQHITHNHFDSAEAVEAALRAMSEPTEGNRP